MRGAGRRPARPPPPSPTSAASRLSHPPTHTPTQKIPSTSVAPTFKLTIPSDFVAAHPELVDADLEWVAGRPCPPPPAAGAGGGGGPSHPSTSTSPLTRPAGEVWEVAILPRRNKAQWEYTLQGWKAFAKAVGVQPGDGLLFEVVPAEGGGGFAQAGHGE